MNHVRLVIQPLLMLALGGAQPTLAACSNCGGGPGDRLCGPKALLLVCTRLGVTTDLDELASLSEMNESGTTMAGLHKAAQGKGLHALGVKISLSELAACTTPAICHLWGDHFVVVESDANGFRVTDPSASEPDQEMSREDFEASYSGFTLLVSREPVALPQIDPRRPDLRFEAYTHDLGPLYEGTKIERTLSFRNAGEQDLTISQVRPSCTCLRAELADKTVPPGGRGSIALTFDTTGLRGGQAHALYIESNDPVSPVVQLQVAAAIKPARLLVSTRRIDFGDVDASAGASRGIFVKDPGDGSLVISEVTADSDLLDVRLGGAAKPNMEIKERVFPLTLTLRPGLPVEEFETSITIISNHPKEPELRIPVFATVMGDIEVSPEMLFLGIVPRGQTASKSASLRARTARALTIKDVCLSSDLFSVEISAKDPGREYVATVTLKDTAPAGLIKGEVHFHTDSALQPMVAVALHALVEDRRGTATDRPSGEATRDPAAHSPVVRVFVFRSQGCTDCELTDNDNMQAIAAKVGCRLEVRYFDIENMANWRKLTDLEKEYHDTDNEMPVVFIGAEVLGGEQEVAAMLEPIIATYAAEGGTAWPDGAERGSQDRD